MRGFRKVLMIGLGGSGKGILVNLKRHLIDSCGEVPPCFKFLVLDTDSRLEAATSRNDGREIHLDPGDLLHLYLPNPSAFLDNAPAEMRDMLYDRNDISLRGISHGAHGIRFAGRLALLARIVDVRRMIEERVTQLNDVSLPRKMENRGFKLYGENPSIFICGSIAGGTGSGVFLDIAILCRQLAEQIQYANDLKIIGVFLLPWVYEILPTTQNCRPNSYAALCELDHFMNFSSMPQGTGSRKGYSAHYGSRVQVQVDKSPFELVHLIDGRNEYGENRSVSWDLLAAVSDAVACEVSEIGDHAGSHLDNIIGTFAQLPPDLWDGKFPHYTSFGIGSIYYPAKEHHAIQSIRSAIELLDQAKVFSIESGAASSDVLLPEIKSFLNEIQLDEDNPELFANRLLGLSGSDTHFRFSQDFDYGSRNIEARVTNLKNQYQNRLERVLEDRIESHYPENRDSVLTIIRERLARYRREESEGKRSSLFTVSWLEQLEQRLSALAEHFNGAIRRCDAEISALNNDEKGHLQDIAAGSHGIFKRKRQGACEKFGHLVTRLIEQSAKRKASEVAAGLMNDLRKEVDKHMATVRSASHGLKDIHTHLNRAQARLKNRLQNIESVLRKRKENPFEVFIGEEDFFYYYASNDLPEIKFNTFMREKEINSTMDLNKTEDQIEKLFLDYTMEKWKFLKEMTVDRVLEHQEKNVPGYTRTQLRHALRLSSPLWSFDRGLLTAERQRHMYQVVVCGHHNADDGRGRYQAIINDIRAGMNMRYQPTWSSTGDPHKISILRYSISLPAYALASMKEYRSHYELQMVPPPHFDKRLRFTLNDLFPEKSRADKAFRVLTLAIVPEIDVIQDKKLDKGHSYTIDYPGELNDVYDPIVHDSFVNLFAYLLENDHVVEALKNKVIEQFEKKGQAVVTSGIESYLGQMNARFESKDFTKQITGRYYYKEIEFLRELMTGLKRSKTIRDFF